ncbi:MAG: histidine phosphatase family protein [bacterium]
MNIYLICNNLLSKNTSFDKNMDIEKKKMLRSLSIKGVELSKKIDIETTAVYSSTYISTIETAKYISEKNDIDIILNESLNDCVIGDLKNKTLKTLSYFQEKDFDYKLESGESLNECSSRIEYVIDNIRENEENAVVFLPRRALFSYISKFCEKDYNLDERIVLAYKEKIMLDENEDDIEIFKLTFEEEEVIIEKVELN